MVLSSLFFCLIPLYLYLCFLFLHCLFLHYPMDLLSILFIAFGLSMDSLAVCIGKGMCRKQFNPWRASKIALVFGLFQGLMPLAGYLLSIGFSKWIIQFDHWLAFVILVMIGVKMMYESNLPVKEEDCSGCDCRDSDAIDWKSVVSLAFATSIDAAATGLIFASYPGTIRKAVVITGVVTFFLSFYGMLLGVRLGHKFRFNFERVGGVILIAIGLKILFTHLLNGA